MACNAPGLPMMPESAPVRMKVQIPKSPSQMRCELKFFGLVMIDLSGKSVKDRFSREFRARTQLLFDAQELVVLRDAIGAGCGSGFDLAAIGSHREIGDKRVFRFAAAMRADLCVTVLR